MIIIADAKKNILYKKALVIYNYYLFTSSFVSLLKEINVFDEIIGCTQLEELQKLTEDKKVTHLFIDFDRTDNDLLSYIQKLSIANKNLFIIVISSIENPGLVLKIRKAGAHAFISKSAGKKEVQECLVAIQSGNYYVTPDVFNNALEAQLNNANELFTVREHDILHHISSGRTINDIAVLLHISRYTVITHRRNMMKKLGVHNMPGLIKKATEIGII